MEEEQEIKEEKTEEAETTDLIDESKLYYDKSNLLSRNGFISIGLGGRGVGKTFNLKLWALLTPGQTVWIRRYVEDIDELLQTNKFMEDLQKKKKIPYDADIKIKENALYYNGELKIFFIPLSTSMRKKSQSFANVNKIIFDEFLETVGKRAYLKRETDIFLELIETINRLRINGEKDVRIVMIANKSTFVNPYFNMWGIHPFSEKFKSFKDGLIVVENYDNEEFKRLKKQSNFGKLVKGTKYEEYAIDNKAWFDNNAFIEKRSEGTKYVCAIRIDEDFIGIWGNVYDPHLYCSKDYNANSDIYAPRYTMKKGEKALVMNDVPMSWLKNYFERGRLFFDNTKIKDMVFNLFQGEWQ